MQASRLQKSFRSVIVLHRSEPRQRLRSVWKKTPTRPILSMTMMTIGREYLSPGVRVFTVAVILSVLVQISLLAVPSEAKTVKYHYNQHANLQTQETSSPAWTGVNSKKQSKAVPVVFKTNVSAAPSTPWRPPVVNLNYHGGLVMSKPIRIHFIWYGSWDPSTKAVIRTALRSLTPATPINEMPNLANWWRIVTEYTQAGGLHVSNSVSIGGEVDDNYSMGNNLGDVAADIVWNNTQPQGGLPLDPVNGLYLLMTSSDVAFVQGGFCGYHAYFCTPGNQPCNINNRIIFAFIPFPGAINDLLNGCNIYSPYGSIPLPAPNDAASPDAGALDSFVSVMMHELMEAATDPYTDAWRQNAVENSEAGDLCSYSYGGGDFYYCGLASIYGPYHGGTDPSVCRTYPGFHAIRWAATGEIFNIFGTGGSRFIVQKIWSLANKGCQLQLQDSCKKTTTLTARTGVIERGVHVFSALLPLQTYGPGENCQWTITVPYAKTLTLNFKAVATGYDQLDHIKVFQRNVLKQTIFGANTSKVVKLTGNSAVVKWTSYGGRSPFPDATGFYMTYSST